MKNFLKNVRQHKLQLGIALVVALGIIFALSTFAAPPKKVPNGQLTFWTHQLSQAPFTNVKVTFKCGDQQKTVNTGPNGKAGPFDVTGTNPKDTRECKIKVTPPANYELIPSNKAELTRTVKAGTKEIVNWTFRPIPADEPTEDPKEDENPADACKDDEVLVITKDNPDGTCITKDDAEENKSTPVPSPPDQVVIVPAEPDEGTPIGDLPDSAPAELPPAEEPDFPPPDEPVADEPEDTPTDEPADDGTDVGNVSGIGDDADDVATTGDSSSGGSSSGSGLSGGGSGSGSSIDSEDLPGISPSPSAAVAAERGSIPAWQQWLLVIVVLGGIGALAYFGLKYYRENQV